MNNVCIMHNIVLIVSDSSMLQILISKTRGQVCPLNSSKLRWVIESILGLRALPRVGDAKGYP